MSDVCLSWENVHLGLHVFPAFNVLDGIRVNARNVCMGWACRGLFYLLAHPFLM